MNDQTATPVIRSTSGQSRSTVGLGAWVPVGVRLPEKDVWVQVFEDDNDNPQNAAWGRLRGTLRQRVTPAKLLHVDSEGYGEWYLCYVGGSHVSHVRNVTHWRPMSEAPNDEVRGCPISKLEQGE